MIFPTKATIYPHEGENCKWLTRADTHTLTALRDSHSHFLSPLLLLISSPLHFRRGLRRVSSLALSSQHPTLQICGPHPCVGTKLHPLTSRNTNTHTKTCSIMSEEPGVAPLIFMESVVLSFSIMWFLASISSRRSSLCFHSTVKRILWKTLEILHKNQVHFHPRGWSKLTL